MKTNTTVSRFYMHIMQLWRQQQCRNGRDSISRVDPIGSILIFAIDLFVLNCLLFFFFYRSTKLLHAERNKKQFYITFHYFEIELSSLKCICLCYLWQVYYLYVFHFHFIQLLILNIYRDSEFRAKNVLCVCNNVHRVFGRCRRIIWRQLEKTTKSHRTNEHWGFATNKCFRFSICVCSAMLSPLCVWFQNS